MRFVAPRPAISILSLKTRFNVRCSARPRWQSLSAGFAVCLSLLLNQEAVAQLSSSTNIPALVSEMGRITGRLASDHLRRAWLHASIARLLLLEQRANEEAEVEFGAAIASSEQSGDRSAMAHIATLRVDLLSVRFLHDGNYDRSWELVEKMGEEGRDFGPILTRDAIREIVCIKRADYRCASDRHVKVIELINRPGLSLWEEDLIVISSLAKVLYEFGLEDIASGLSAYAAGFYEDEHRRVAGMIQASEYLTGSELPFDAATDLIKSIKDQTSAWRPPSPAARAKPANSAVEQTSKIRGRLRAEELLIQAHHQLIAGPEGVLELLAKYRQVLEDYGDLESPSEGFAWWLEARATEAAGGIQKGLEVAFNPPTSLNDKAAELVQTYVLARQLSRFGLRKSSAKYATAYAKLNEQTIPGARRLVAGALMQSDMFDQAFTVVRSLVEPRVHFAEAGGPIGTTVFDDLTQLTFAAALSQDQSHVVAVRQVLDRLRRVASDNTYLSELSAALETIQRPLNGGGLPGLVQLLKADLSLPIGRKLDLLWIALRGQPDGAITDAELLAAGEYARKLIASGSDRLAGDRVRLYLITVRIRSGDIQGATQTLSELGDVNALPMGEQSLRRLFMVLTRARLDSLSGAKGASVSVLCEASGMFLDAGQPDAWFLRPTADEMAALVSRDRPARESPCPSDPGKPDDFTSATEVSIAGRRQEDQLLSVRARLSDALADQSRARRVASMRGLLKAIGLRRGTDNRQEMLTEAFDAVDKRGMPFSAEALAIAEEVLAEGDSTRPEFRLAAAERIAIAADRGALSTWISAQSLLSAKQLARLSGASSSKGTAKRDIKVPEGTPAASVLPRSSAEKSEATLDRRRNSELEQAVMAMAPLPERTRDGEFLEAQRTRVCERGKFAGISKLAAVAEQLLEANKLLARVAYRFAQANLYCGERETAGAWLQKSLAQARRETKPAHAVLYQAWWVSDLSAVEGESGAVAAAVNTIGEVQRLPPMKDAPSRRYILDAVTQLVLAGQYSTAATLADRARQDFCVSSSTRTDCKTIAHFRALTAALGQKDAGSQALARALASSAVDSISAVAALQIATDSALSAIDRGRSADAQLLLEAASDVARRFQKALLPQRPVTSNLIGMAWGYACLRDTASSISMASQVIAPGRALVGDTQLLADTGPDAAYAASETRRPLLSAVLLNSVHQVLAANGTAALVDWKAAGLPDILVIVKNSKIPLSERAYALLRIGKGKEAMRLLKSDLVRFSREVVELDSQELQSRVVLYLASSGPTELQVNEKILRLFDQAVTTKDDRAVVRATTKRLLAELAYARGDLDGALRTLLSAHVVDSALNRAIAMGDPRDRPETIFEVVAQLTIEDLESVVRNRALALAVKTDDEWGDSSWDDLRRLNESLRSSQRSLLALLLARSGAGMGGTEAERVDLSFKVLQSAVVGPTAVDLLSSLRQLEVADLPSRRAQLVVERDAEKMESQLARDSLGAARPWEGTGASEMRERLSKGCAALGRTVGGPTSPLLDLTAYRQDELDHASDDGADRLSSFSESGEADKKVADAQLKLGEKFWDNDKLWGKQAKPLSYVDVKSRLSEHQAIFFVYSSSRRTYVTLVTSTGLFADEAKLGGRALDSSRLEQLVQAAREDTFSGTTGAMARWRDSPGAILYRALFGPFTAKLTEITELAIVPRGPAETLPFGILQVDAATALKFEWFDDRFAWYFALAPSRGGPADKSTDPRGPVYDVVQFGPPQFTGQEPECARPVSGAEPPSRLLESRLCNIDGLAELHSHVRAPSSGDRQVAHLMWIGASASKRNLVELSESRKLDSTDVLIIATHGLVPSEAAALGGRTMPAIVLAADGNYDPRGALLTTAEIENMNLGANEVVLVACNSAGPAASSEERAFSGLVRSFIRGGARSVVAAMFSVPTDPTDILLSKYFEYRSQGEPMANALQRARRFLRERGARPDQWAGMAAIGVY